MANSGDLERRNKGKDKFRERKKHPYRKGGMHRAVKGVSLKGSVEEEKKGKR